MLVNTLSVCRLYCQSRTWRCQAVLNVHNITH